MVNKYTEQEKKIFKLILTGSSVAFNKSISITSIVRNLIISSFNDIDIAHFISDIIFSGVYNPENFIDPDNCKQYTVKYLDTVKSHLPITTKSGAVVKAIRLSKDFYQFERVSDFGVLFKLFIMDARYNVNKNIVPIIVELGKVYQKIGKTYKEVNVSEEILQKSIEDYKEIKSTKRPDRISSLNDLFNKLTKKQQLEFVSDWCKSNGYKVVVAW